MTGLTRATTRPTTEASRRVGALGRCFLRRCCTYTDAGLTSFAVIARGSGRSAQFLGLVAPGGSTRFVVRELEPTAHNILDGQFVAQPTLRDAVAARKARKVVELS